MRAFHRGSCRRAVWLTLAVYLAGAGVAGAQEVIRKFDSVVQLARDGALTVTETVRVRAEGNAIKRGIYRDFPMTFTDAGGRGRDVDFTLLSVTRDGKPEPYRTERQSRYVRIYAGDKDVMIATGDHTYVFRYRTARQVRWFDGKAELNWNVTGNFWNFPILSATYRLELEPGERPLRWTAFSGALGAQGKDWRGAVDSNGVLTVETTRALAAGGGLTVVAGLAPGAVDPLTSQQETRYWIFDNRHWLFGGAGFVLVLIYYVAAWRAVGRDPRPGIVIPQFHPPDGVSPALANYIDNWGFGRDRWRSFTAAALSLAVKGRLKFDQHDDRLTLTAVKSRTPGEAPLPAGENAIMTFMNQHDGKGIIDKAHGVQVAALGSKFTAGVEAESANRFFRRNLGYAVAGLAMTIAVVIGVLIVGGLQDNDIGVLIVSAFGSFFLALFIIPMLTALFGRHGLHSIFRSLMSFAVFAIFISIFVALVTSIIPDDAVALPPLLLSFVENYPFSFVLISAFAALNGLFFYLMRAPTALGRPIMDHLAGLRLYIETAETDRLNSQAPEITAERFEAILPYAVALNLEKPWSDAFAAAVRRAHPDDAEAMAHYQPAWSSGGGWSGANFGTAVATSVGSVSSALASAVPVSSSSSGFSSGGGGGSSGGGGGGGGGGGW
jgi:hypothetical protein